MNNMCPKRAEIQNNGKSEELNYYEMRYVDYRALDNSAKQKLDGDVQGILKLISYDNKQIERCPNDILFTCQNDSNVVGFAHIVPQNFNCEYLENRFDTQKMYVDYIAVNPQYQGQGIATNLYKLCAKALKKIGAKELNAVLFDEYSRRAFCKVMKKCGGQLTENAIDGSVSAVFKDMQMER